MLSVKSLTNQNQNEAFKRNEIYQSSLNIMPKELTLCLVKSVDLEVPVAATAV